MDRGARDVPVAVRVRGPRAREPSASVFGERDIVIWLMRVCGCRLSLWSVPVNATQRKIPIYTKNTFSFILVYARA